MKMLRNRKLSLAVSLLAVLLLLASSVLPVFADGEGEASEDAAPPAAMEGLLSSKGSALLSAVRQRPPASCTISAPAA